MGLVTATDTVTGLTAKRNFTVPQVVPFTALAGASVVASDYPGVTTPVAAAQMLDSFLAPGVTPAMTRQKGFLQEGQWPNPLPSGILALLQAGVKMQVSVRPKRASDATTIASEIANLQQCITLLKATGTPFEVDLYSEPNNNNAFPSGGVDYPAYWANYAPAVKAAGVPLIFNPGSNTGNYPQALGWIPQLNPLPDILYADWYAWSFAKQCYPDQPLASGSKSFFGLADGLGIPVGLGEYGFGGPFASMTQYTDADKQLIWGSPKPFVTSYGVRWTISYIGYIVNMIQTRRFAGKPLGDFCGYFEGTNTPQGIIQSATDYKTGNLAGTLGVNQVWSALQ